MSIVADLMPEHPADGEYHGNIADDLATGDVRLSVSVVSPESEIFSGRANWIVAPGADGSFGVWPRHASLVAALSSGMLRIGLVNHETLEYLVRGAFLSVNANVVTVLIDKAVSSPEEVDVEAARAELAETSEAMTKRVDDVEYLQLLDHREWCQAQLRYVERRPDWVPKNV